MNGERLESATNRKFDQSVVESIRNASRELLEQVRAIEAYKPDDEASQLFSALTQSSMTALTTLAQEVLDLNVELVTVKRELSELRKLQLDVARLSQELQIYRRAGR